ncbi:acetyl-CoA hydrolase [Pseudidiomarina salinarum]|uniref:Acetyl-CoA hydrolase n=2 Tax=Pseudidiomarina salinarum TaxID=435908 RepID=A0A094IS82_9GAMM|nr:acetyl-CoA hydrolase [Pseudidiomarina salinarum]RUO69302.1 acetyl-CoA hydrolase [Pseudidiomarina salinarum]
MPKIYQYPDQVADAIIQQVGKTIVLGLPLGLGKANHIANALLQRAVKDSSIQLKIVTALSLEAPRPGSELGRRFFEPARERLFGNYPDLDYIRLIREQRLPDNIQVSEFFFMAGQWSTSPVAQQSYIPVNYSHALGLLVDQGVNVVAQILAREGDDFSLSCNPDITADLLKLRRQGKLKFVLAGQYNSELPFMGGDAQIGADQVDVLLDSEETDFELFSIPKRPVSFQDQAIGLHAARLVRDGGSLQIGIGSIGDAIAHSLILRHKQNRDFRRLVADMTAGQPALADAEDTPFAVGLYGISEMFVDGFLHLAEHGILKREVDGAILHGGFFADCRSFYRRLREMSSTERARFVMKPVSFTNHLYGQEHEKRQAREKASFINNAMMATLRGAIVSDGLADGRVISGVGGQHDFVDQAFALEDARCIITVNATRTEKGKARSNIVWNYGHQTIPWHLRDIVVTEYGVAKLRGKTESEAIKAMLNISDSRFQDELLEQAKQAGKVEKSWQIPSAWRDNTPERLNTQLYRARQEGLLPKFPLGTDFTETEQRLLAPLELLKDRSHSKWALTKMILSGLLAGTPNEHDQACLERMQLASPSGFKERIYQKLLLAALAESRV